MKIKHYFGYALIAVFLMLAILLAMGYAAWVGAVTGNEIAIIECRNILKNLEIAPPQEIEFKKYLRGQLEKQLIYYDVYAATKKYAFPQLRFLWGPFRPADEQVNDILQKVITIYSQEPPDNKFTINILHDIVEQAGNQKTREMFQNHLVRP